MTRGDAGDDDGVRRWQERAVKSLEALSPHLERLADISIETLWYPPAHLFPVLDAVDVSLCIDAGHLIKYGYDITSLFQRYGHRVPLMHLHGVDFSHDPPRDHLGLSRTPADRFAATREVLSRFTGVVSLEVFKREHLKDAVDFLNRII